MAYGSWPKYVSVAERKAKAQKKIAALKKKGKVIRPVEITGRKIARSFWGMAWCTHLEKFGDYENRLPRGRTYVRNGSVCHLEITEGRIKATVAGSRLYHIDITIDPLPKTKWSKIQAQCAGSVGSMVELLQGKLSDSVMRSVTDQHDGLFPQSSEIHLHCDCPDWADLCKHLAAVLYGVGARLDEEPALLFLLRGVDQRDLLAGDLNMDTGSASVEVGGDLAELFGIDLDDSPLPAPKNPPKAATATQKNSVLKSRASKVKEKAPPNAQPVLKPSGRQYTAEVLEDFRGLHALTQEDFSRLIGLSLATVKKWENEPRELKLKAISRTALDKVFDMSEARINREREKLQH